MYHFPKKVSNGEVIMKYFLVTTTTMMYHFTLGAQKRVTNN